MIDSEPWHPENLNTAKPLYLAIADALERDIRCGILKAGQKLPTQRELAETIGVNLSTLTRAFRECELRGLISGTVGRGTYIAADTNVPITMDPPEAGSPLLEMGLVLPLYELDDLTAAAAGPILQSLDLKTLLPYTEPAGLASHRAAGSAWINRFGLATAPEDILVTSGSQSALTCCLMALFKPGDRLAVDALTYPGIKALAAMLGIRLVPIEMDEAGMNPDALSTACRRDGLRGIYLMPEFQNPTTISMPNSRREQIAAIIERQDLILLEDDAYGYTGDFDQPALSAALPGHGIYIFGTSKLLGPGFRISFAAAPQRFRSQIEKAILNTVWMASPITAEIVSQLLMNGGGDAIMQRKRQEAERRTALALARLAPYTMFSRPAGFFLWLLLPPNWTGREFELTAREAGVKVFCAEKFTVGSKPTTAAIRVALTGPPTIADLERGLTVMNGILSGWQRKTEAIF